jgi:hypothetical protein
MAVSTRVEQQDIKKLENCLLVFYPDEYVIKQITSTKDMYAYRFTLRNIKFANGSFRHLLTLVTNAVEHNQRLKTYACIKLLRDILQTNTDIELEKDITDKLFYLFQRFVFSANPEVQRHANNLIRGRLLADEQIVWLIENYKKSLHIVNRLLRYPQSNMHITAWAREMYACKELPERTAEVLSILITNDLPAIDPGEDINSILWAIYYSKNTSEIKQELLLHVVNEENLHQCLDSVASIAVRIDGGSLIKTLIKTYG